MLRAIDRHCQPFLAHTVLPSAFLFIFHHTTPSIKQKESRQKAKYHQYATFNTL